MQASSLSLRLRFGCGSPRARLLPKGRWPHEELNGAAAAAVAAQPAKKVSAWSPLAAEAYKQGRFESGEATRRSFKENSRLEIRIHMHMHLPANCHATAGSGATKPVAAAGKTRQRECACATSPSSALRFLRKVRRRTATTYRGPSFETQEGSVRRSPTTLCSRLKFTCS